MVGRVVLNLSSECFYGQTVLGLRLLRDLVYQLPRGTEVDHPFLVLPSTPLSEQETYQRLSTASWQLQRNVSCFKRLRNVVAQDLPLMIVQARMFAAWKVSEKPIWTLEHSCIHCRFFKGHGA